MLRTLGALKQRGQRPTTAEAFQFDRGGRHVQADRRRDELPGARSFLF
jgi:hypothetical protein